MSDGVPTTTLTWYKPDQSKINSVRDALNTVDVKMEVDQDFGTYNCHADNGLTPADFEIVKIEQISKCSLSLLGVILVWLLPTEKYFVYKQMRLFSGLMLKILFTFFYIPDIP